MCARFLATVLVLVATAPAPGSGVVVIANRTGRDVTGTVSTPEEIPRRVTIGRGELTVLTVSRAADFSFISANRRQTARVQENSVYGLTAGGDGILCDALYVGAEPPARERPGPEGAVVSPPVATLTVKLLVDGQEPDKDWEGRLCRRVAAASKVLEDQCRVRLEVAEVATWESSAEARSFDEQLEDFSRRVSARPAAVAIGFSSRPLSVSAPRRRDRPLAALPVPLQSHILIGEWFPLPEAQRLDVLLHELGHFLGAAHSKDADSIMRMNPSDGRSADKNAHIGYDPLNVLAMNLVAREALAVPPKRKLGALSTGTRTQLARLYKEMARILPDDAAPERYLQLLDEAPPPRPPAAPDPLVDGARSVVAVMNSAADAAGELRLTGDHFTEHCVRAAAGAANKLPETQRVPAFLLALAVALDTSDALRKAAPTHALWGRVEDDAERAGRLKLVGQPTMQGRHNLARHFVVAAALTSIAGSRAADPGGIVRELFEGEEAGGFSFAELAAEYAGATFARTLARDPGRLATIAVSFPTGDYVPAPAGLEDALSREEFARRFGSFSDERFRERERELRRRVAELPAYRSK